MFVKHEYVHLEFHVLFMLYVHKSLQIPQCHFFLYRYVVFEILRFTKKINLTCHVLEIVKVIGISEWAVEKMYTGVVRKMF